MLKKILASIIITFSLLGMETSLNEETSKELDKFPWENLPKELKSIIIEFSMLYGPTQTFNVDSIQTHLKNYKQMFDTAIKLQNKAIFYNVICINNKVKTLLSDSSDEFFLNLNKYVLEVMSDDFIPCLTCGQCQYTEIWDLVKLLINLNKLDIKARNSFNQNILMVAAERNCISILRLLKNSIAENNLHINDKSRGMTPIMRAAEEGHIEAVMFLIENGADINIYDNISNSAISLASRQGHKHIVELLIRSSNERNKEIALIEACKHNHNEIVEILINFGTNLNTIQFGHTALNSAIECGFIEIVKLLLHNRANIHLQDGNGRTALAWAVHRQNEEIKKLLLNHKAPYYYFPNIKFARYANDYIVTINFLKYTLRIRIVD